MYGTIERDSMPSLYQPSREVCDFTAEVKRDYAIGEEILNRTYLELNNESVISDENNGQLMFNAFVDTSDENPAEAWKWKGSRSMARNKGIAMHAQLTAGFLLPMFSAQNENDEQDRDFSEIMRDIVEWMCLPNNSNYQSSFIQVGFGMITNPVTYLGAEYCEVFQTIKEKTEKGYTTKEVLDEVLSGFKAPIWSSSQVLITNAYQRNIQRQRAIIRRRWCEKQELEAKYGSHDNWSYVRAGVKTLYNDETGLFYDVKDDEHPTLVAEEIYYNRRNDTEVAFVGGIYMGDPNIDDNPIKHRDNRNTPKYNIVPYGYSRIGDHFFYYKSMMNCLKWDNMLYDAMSEIVMNRAILEVEMPLAVSGSEKVDSEIVAPGVVTAFEDPNARVTPLLPASNMVGGFNALRETEKSITEGSVSEVTAGQLPEASQKAYSVATAQANAKRLIGAVGKSLVESTTMYGDLMKDIVINHITIAQIDELVGDGMKLKYKNFVLEDQNKGRTKNIYFDEALIGVELTEEEMNRKNLELLEKSGYPEKKTSLRLVNPELFARFKYLSRCDVEEMFPRNQEYWQPILMNLTSMLANDPYIDQELLRRKLIYSIFKSEGDELVKKQPEPSALPTPALPESPYAAEVDQRAVKSPAVEAGVL